MVAVVLFLTYTKHTHKTHTQYTYTIHIQQIQVVAALLELDDFSIHLFIESLPSIKEDADDPNQMLPTIGRLRSMKTIRKNWYKIWKRLE